MAFLAAGILLVALGLISKLGALIASIPGPVIGGVFAVLCAVIAMNGLRILRQARFTERNMMVIGLPVLFALFATMVPKEFVDSMPELFRYVLGSSIAFGAIAAILLNLVLPEREAAGA